MVWQFSQYLSPSSCSAYSAPGGWTSLTASSPEFGTGQTGTHRNHIRTPQSNRGRSTTGASIWMRPSPVLTPRFGAVRPLGKYRAAHEGSIILHEAAAKALKAAGISGKLPHVAALQADYAKLHTTLSRGTLTAFCGRTESRNGIRKWNGDK